ncbi:MAG TPA: OmpA family protein [Bacteroidales bacterium]|nr:OmpA family protein [Bacteroidales bacterium]HPS16529.1 OmpA family protein [Bacteroidales bacterium]
MKKNIYKVFLIVFVLFFLPKYAVFSQEDGEETNDDCKVKNKKAEKIYKDGYAEFKNHSYTTAAKFFKEAIDEEPGYVEAYYGLAKIFTFQEKYSTAKKYYLKVAELCPSYDIYVFYYLGQIYLGAEKYDSANYYMNEFTKGVENLTPEKQKLYKNLDKDFSHADSVKYYSKNMTSIMSKTVPFNPVYVKGVSSVSDEYLPIITPDNEMCLYTRKSATKTKSVYADAKLVYTEKFMYSKRKDGSFDEGYEMPSPFNENSNEGGATLTIDNKYLFYTVCKYLTDKDNKAYFNCDICTSTFTNGSWSEIKSVSPKVNNDKTWESQPSISSDGKDLYFLSDRDGGYGGYDIYVTHKQDSSWSVPENLGPNINTSGNEKSPFIHTDNQTLYFSSTGWPGLGGYDIYYSKKEANGKFGKPTNIGYPINSEGDDVGFFVSTDGHYGYFASNDITRFKGPGGWDVYSFDLYPEARPDTTVHLIKGNIKDEQKDIPTSAKVELKNVKTKQVTEVEVDSITGKYVIAALMKNDYMLTVKKDDYAYSSKYISKEDTAVTENTNVKVDFDIKPIAVGETYKLNDIYFDYGSFELSENSKLIIDGFIDFLNDHPNIKVAIHGHTDNISGTDFNMTLSENRAKSVYDYIAGKGIDAARLSYKGFGLTQPVASNDTEQGRAKNRRTEFVITEK